MLGAALAFSILVLPLAPPTLPPAPAPVDAAGALAAECPAREAVTAEVGRMGAGAALARTGSIDVAVDDAAGMRLVPRGGDGLVLGTREVAAPASCHERALVAAVVIVTWLGEWSKSAAASPAVMARPFAAPLVPIAAAAAPAARPSRRLDVAAFAFGTHDGDAGAFGLGGVADVGLGDVVSLAALAEWTGERSRPLGPGEASDWSLRFGLGVAARRALGRGGAFVDVGLAPEVVRLWLRGQGLALAPARSAVAWSVAVDARLRVGVRVGAVAPFVQAGASYALIGQRLTLDGSPDSDVTLPRWGFGAGVGLMVLFGPLGG